MAVVNPTITRFIGSGDGSLVKATWVFATEADTASAIVLPEFADKSVQVFGTFGTVHIAMHGSNDAGTTFAALNDPSGTVIDIAAAKIKAILENTEQIKPVVTAGTGGPLTVVMLARLSNPLRT